MNFSLFMFVFFVFFDLFFFSCHYFLLWVVLYVLSKVVVVLCEKILVESEQICFMYICSMQGHSGYVCVLWVVVLWNEWRSSVFTWGRWTLCSTWSLTKSFWLGCLFGCFVTTCFKLFCLLWQLFHPPPPEDVNQKWAKLIFCL